jgi:RNA polymerase sigma factor (sigma-70 family)
MTQLDLRAVSDAELVARFAAGRDQRAFAEVVRRHGPMVMAAALRVLRSKEDAEDAFQATFLALAQACAKLRRKTALAAWLHQAAVRTALSIGRANGKWQRRIDRKKEGAAELYTMRPRDDLSAVLDEELQRLAPPYRAAIVLCDLEGLSRDEAAGRLGISTGTLKTRLARGRRLLRERLVRRGVAVSAAGLASIMSGLAAAALPMQPGIVGATTKNALLFAAGHTAAEMGVSTTITQAAQGVITAMTLMKLSMLGGAALAIVLGATAIDGVSGVLSSLARAETIFFDNFDDGDAGDGSPVAWVPVPGASGTFDASTGDYVVAPSQYFASAGVPQHIVSDVSIRAQVRVLEPSGAGGGPYLIARGSRSSGIAYTARVNEDGLAAIERTSPVQTFASVRTDLRPLEEDVVMQLDVFGSSLSFWAWRAGEPRPKEPLLTATNSVITQAGEVGVAYYSIVPNHPVLGSAAYRFVHVADTSIPEPSTATLSSVFFAGVIAWQWRRWR